MRALRGDRHGVLVGMTPFGARVWLADSDASVEYVAHAFAESALTTLTRSAPERAGMALLRTPLSIALSPALWTDVQ